MADKLKILQLIDGGFIGGGQRNILSILRNLDKGKFISHAAAGRGKFGLHVADMGIHFYSVDLPKILRSKHLKKLQSIQDRVNFDIVHSHGGTAGFYGRLLKKHNPYLRSVHTIHGIHYLNSDNILRKAASKAVEQYLVQFTDKTICETHSDYKQAIDAKIADSGKTVIINNGINISTFANLKRDNSIREKYGLSENNFIIGNISRFDEQKNQRLIIQASYYLLKKYPEMRFVLAGDGKQFKKIIEYARESHLEDYIIFTGEVDNPEELYSIFDVYVLPSLWEGMSISLLEAMASRLPIVCSNIPGNLEVIKHNYSALTINPYEADDLVLKLSLLHNNPELIQKISENAFIEATQYDEAEMTRKLENVYEEVMS